MADGLESFGSVEVGRRTGRRLAAMLLAAALGCGDGSDAPSAEEPLAAQGRLVYQNVCIACHHGDPAQDGSLGPAIAGSSRELIEAKVLRGEYPPGYTPKRPNSGAMPRFEYLADRIDALAAYLQSVPTRDAPR